MAHDGRRGAALAGAAAAVALAAVSARRRWTDHDGMPSQAEALLASLLAQDDLSIVTFDDDLTIRSWNAGAERLYGWSGAEATGLNPFHLDLVSERAAPTHEAALRRALQGQGSTFQTEVRRPDGALVSSLCTLTPIRDEDGTVLGVTAVSRDIRDWLRADAERRHLAALVESADLAVFSVDRDLDVTSWNAGAERMLGHRSEDVMGRSIRGLLPPAEVERLQGTLDAAGPTSGQATLQRSDGGHVDVMLTCSPIPADGRPDEVVGASGIARDITSWVADRRELERSEERFRRLADRTRGIVFEFRRDPPRYEYVNPAVEQILGWTPRALYEDARIVRDAVDPAHVDRLGLGRVLAGEPDGVTTYRIHTEAGEWIWLEEHFTGLYGEDGAVTGVQGVAYDVSAAVAAEQALRDALEHQSRATQELRRTNRMQEAFLRAVSHELRTPLTAVVGFAETLRLRRRQLDDGRIGELLERLVTNARQLRSLLEDLLDVDRLASLTIEPRLERARIDEIAVRAADQVELGDRRLVLETRPLLALVDVARIERILVNLLGNAAKHTPPGTTITLRVETGGDAVRLIVEDDGPGIPDELKRTVFEPFVQGEDQWDSPRPGTGIGLSLVERFAELHGGTVVVDDRPGGGTRVEVCLPQDDGELAHNEQRSG